MENSELEELKEKLRKTQVLALELRKFGKDLPLRLVFACEALKEEVENG